MNRKTPRIALTLGDPAGIGPEIVARVVESTRRPSTQLVLVGDYRHLEQGYRHSGRTGQVPVIEDVAEIPDHRRADVVFLHRESIDPGRVPIGKADPACGRATFETLKWVLGMIREGLFDGFCFGPLNKAAMMQGGLEHHSELDLFKNEMPGHRALEEINFLDGMWTMRVTSHIPLRAVADRLTIDAVHRALVFFHEALTAYAGRDVRIAVAALNPHGGEQGLCGREEIDVIEPAIEKGRAAGIKADGPFPADTVFLKVKSGDYMGVLNMYHDQGQIATKLLGFNRGVTYHHGFDVPITTCAHGTAFDIAGKGLADETALAQALKICVGLSERLLSRVAT